MEMMKLKNNERLFSEKRIAVFRKEQFEYIHTGIVDTNGETWTTTQLDEANLNQVYNQYRHKYGIPYPDEIIRLREYYGVSAAKMSEILGFGTNQYRYYEDGEVQSVSNARTLVAIRDKNVFLDFLNASRNVIGEKEFGKISQRVEAQPPFAKPMIVPSSLNGYITPSVEKLRDIMLFFIDKMHGVFVTKMNKLLFYSDFLSYKLTGYGLSGLEYNALQFGPVPKNWGSIFSNIPDIYMVECVFANGAGGIKLESIVKPSLSTLTESEKEVLSKVCSRFLNDSAHQISLVSHQERGWIENESKCALIDYSYAFDLSL